jgi:hypothetical protein
MIKILKVVVFILIGYTLHGQTLLSNLEKELAYQADVMINASMPQHRLRAMDQFNTKFDQALAIQGSYDYPFDELKWISKKSPDDQSFRMFTWEVDAGNGEFKYFGIIQMKNEKTFVLSDHLKTAESLADEEFDQDHWIGALYYNIMEGTSPKGQKYYMLFGVNRYSAYENIKMIDILFFSDEGMPYFGLPVFRKTEKGQKDVFLNRLVFKYASDGQMTVNYNPGMKMIMVDNLVRKMSRIPGQGETMIPDGSYVGYELKDGYWQRIDQIAVTPMDKAPRPQPILDQRKNSNIFGKKNK